MNRSLTKHWDRLEGEALKTAQTAALRAYLSDVVVPFSPFYRKLFADAGIDPGQIRSPDDLRRLPFTTKQDLLATAEEPEKPRQFVIQPDAAVLRRRPGTIIRALTRGKNAAEEALEREFRPLILTSTTGRSSRPVPFLYTRHDLEHLKTAGRRMMELCDSHKEFRHLNVFPFAPHLAFWQMHYAGIGFHTFCLSTGGGKTMGTDGNVSMIEKIKPEAIIGMPTFVYHLFHTALERNVKWTNLRRVVLGGEKAPRGLRRKLRELAAALGSTEDVRIMSTYGFTEAKTAWPECAFGKQNEPTGFHLYPDLGIVEIVDPETGEPVGEGEGGEIVYTPLDSRGTVALRYRTGDLIEGGVHYAPCPACGRRMPRLVGRISRVSHRHEMHFEKVKGTLVDFNELESVLDDTDGLGAWQIELRKVDDDPLERDELIVHAHAIDGHSTDALREAISDHLFRNMEIRPNAIRFHDAAEMRRLQGVGVELKEKRLVDNRARAAEPDDESAPAPATSS